MNQILISQIARKGLNKHLVDRTRGALYFPSGKATTSWSAEYIKTVEIGEFSFYNPHDGAEK